MYKDQLFHEQNMLMQWEQGDTSLLPDDWSIVEQRAFIKGMEHAEELLTSIR